MSTLRYTVAGTIVPVTVLVLCWLSHVQALIPSECVKNVTVHGQMCCPKNPHNGMICGGSGRGFCQHIAAGKESIPKVLWVDDRVEWPTRFIQYACQCTGHFFGVACEQCWFGWTGPNCDQPEKRIRRDIRTYSPDELNIFKDVLTRSWSWPSNYMILDESTNMRSDPLNHPKFLSASVQYYITFVNSYASRTTLYNTRHKCEEYGILDFNHDGPTFPTWHRYLMLIWERMLAEIAWKAHGIKNFALPYWDWVGLLKCDICDNKYVGAPGKKDKDGIRLDPRSIFYNATNYCWYPKSDALCVGCQAGGRVGKLVRRFVSEVFPTQADIGFMLGLKNYFISGERDTPRCESFHMALEGFCGRPGADSKGLWINNKVHNMIEGSMQRTATATNDPIYILHQAFIDKLFSMWYRRHKPPFDAYPNHDVRPGHKRDAFLAAILPLARNSDMFTDVSNLGYDYDKPSVVGLFAHNGGKPVYL
ncbi:common central domain of tyrosinase [Opisthorchis viverrini]|nr:common central domain of tyrosinase [Opisthorchis viverrini]